MAEAIGLSVGIAGLAFQISHTINAVRQMRSKPDELLKGLTVLLERLEVLKTTVLLLQPSEGNPLAKDLICHMKPRYEELERVIRHHLVEIQKVTEEHCLNLKRARLLLSRQPKQLSQDLGLKIDRLIMELNLQITTLGLVTRSGNIQDSLPAIENEPDLLLAQDDDLEHNIPEEDREAYVNTASNFHSESDQEHRLLIPAARCNSHSSHVQLHNCSAKLSSIVGRFWFLHFTPLSRFITKSNDEIFGCNCMSLHMRLALSIYGLPLAITAGIQFQCNSTGLSLQTTLRSEWIVNYTSPGFETIWRLKNGLISIQEARRRFLDLYRANNGTLNQKDPAGHSYIYTLLRYPWFSQDDQFDLLQVLVTECEMTLQNESEEFLIKCAKWIGEGRHLALLQDILAYGFDVTAIHASPFDQWPEACSPDWYGLGMTPDPFFIDYIGTILRYSPSYSGSTYLHSVLLNGRVDSARYWLSRSRPLESNVNFLGQTPLHIVTARPELCSYVLEAGHDMNVSDKSGATPLMYAAAMGQSKVVKLLISRGANPTLRDGRYNWNFLNYALFCHHWNLVIEALSVIQSKFDSEVLQFFVWCALMGSLAKHAITAEQSAFESKLIELLDNVNIRFGDINGTGNTLMHYAFSFEIASTLIRRGFNSFNHRNSEGKHFINSLASRPDPDIVQLCLENGMDLKDLGQGGRPIFCDVLSNLAVLDWRSWDTTDVIQLCMSAGADPFAADSCICSCSPGGCDISSCFSLNFDFELDLSGTPSIVWALDMLSLVEEFHSPEKAKEMLLSLHRRLRHDEARFSIAHVCCHNGQGLGQRTTHSRHLGAEDADEILIEEEEFIALLDEKMEGIASLPFSELLSKFIALLKIKCDNDFETVRREEKKYRRDSKSRTETYTVDYKNDTYSGPNITCTWLRTSTASEAIAKKVAQYAFWLQHEYHREIIRKNKSSHKAGWFERRISRLLKFMNIMDITPTILAKAMDRISITETRTEKIDLKKTINSFFEALEKVKLEAD